MKIALVSPYDFSYPGGVVNHICNLEQNFTRMGHVVKIIAPASCEVTGYGDRFIHIGTPRPIPTSGSIARITISFTLTDKVKEVLQKEKFDIVHLHEPLVPTLGFTVLRLSNTVNIGTFHAAEAKPSYRWAKPIGFSRLYKRWFRKLDGRIAVSVPARDYINRHYPSNYEIIPNGVDTNRFTPEVPPLPEFRDGKVNILFLGRTEKRKGLEYLLKAYSLIKPDIPDCRLIIVSPKTRKREGYEEQVAEAGLEDVVFIDGRSVTEATKPRYYSTADIFCAPATGHESFGIVLLEAMATGKPVEYHFKNINQIQVNAKAGMTFASALRSILRLDPNVILIGEIRDAETANIAVQSALTGHLVLSSIHANDSVGVIFRLLDLGIEPFLVASSLAGIVAQRMVRRICPDCARPVKVSLLEQMIYMKETHDERREFLYGAGCSNCSQTGYMGRMGIYEILRLSDEMKMMLLKGSSTVELKNQAMKEGLITLLHDGMNKVKANMTTPSEILKTAYTQE